MPPVALALLLTAALMHAGWNLLVKRAAEQQIFTWWALLVGAVCLLPLVIVNLPLPPRVWPYIADSAALEALYFLALTRGYAIADFSLIYPIGRGAAPIFLAIWAPLFLGEKPHPGGLFGLALLILGLLVVGSAGLWTRRWRAALNLPGIVAALAVAVCISGYTVIDGKAVRFVNPLPYAILVLGSAGVLTTPIVLLRYGRPAMLREWRASWPRIVLVALLSLGTYAIVLYVYTVARVGYAGSIREVSIVFAAVAGWRFLGERFGAVRTVGAVLIFCGILSIAILG